MELGLIPLYPHRLDPHFAARRSISDQYWTVVEHICSPRSWLASLPNWHRCEARGLCTDFSDQYETKFINRMVILPILYELTLYGTSFLMSVRMFSIFHTCQAYLHPPHCLVVLYHYLQCCQSGTDWQHWRSPLSWAEKRIPISSPSSSMMSVRPSAKELLGSSLDKWWHSYPTHNQGGVTIMYLSGYIHYLYFCIFLCSMHFLYFLVPYPRSRRCQHYVFFRWYICCIFLYFMCFLVQYPQSRSCYPFVFIWV